MKITIGIYEHTKHDLLQYLTSFLTGERWWDLMAHQNVSGDCGLAMNHKSPASHIAESYDLRHWKTKGQNKSVNSLHLHHINQTISNV